MEPLAYFVGFYQNLWLNLVWPVLKVLLVLIYAFWPIWVPLLILALMVSFYEYKQGHGTQNND